MKAACRVAAAMIAVTGGVSVLNGAEPEVPKLPEFEFHPVPPALTEVGKNAGIALEGIAPAGESAGEFTPGDRVTALVTLAKGRTLTQWLIELSCVDLNEKEKQMPPLKTWTLFTNTGTEVILGGTRAVLAVRVFGPYQGDAVSDPKKEQPGRIQVNADYLRLGLDHGCESVIVVNAAKAQDPALKSFAWGARLKPYSAEEVAEGRKLAEPLGFTPERERALVGTNPALREFFNVMSRTPGLEDILKNVIDVPWWTIIKRGGNAPVAINPQFRFAEEITGEPFRLGARKAYALPFQLTIGGKRALVGKLAVTSARPPLSTCAGIVGVTAWGPDGEGPRVMLQVISARLGAREAGARSEANEER